MRHCPESDEPELFLLVIYFNFIVGCFPCHPKTHNGRREGRVRSRPSRLVRNGNPFYLRECRFECATVFGCDFRQADLRNASLMRADLRGCYFAGAILIGANLFEADLREGVHVQRGRSGEFHVLHPEDKPTAVSGADFSGANLTNASLSGVIAIKTDFSNAIMRGCKLVRAHVRGANFSNCDLEGADFSQADTRDACFRGAVTAGANFAYANLAGADLFDVLSDAPKGRPIAESDVELKELLRLHLRFIGTGGSDGQSLDLSGFDLRNSGSMAGACLTMLMAKQTVFYGLDLSRVAIQAAKCADADFRNCKLDEADMRGIQLAGAKLNNATMRKVKLGPLRLDQDRQISTDLSGVSMRHADLVGADMRGVLLVGADLSFADLNGANLTGADLTNAGLNSCTVTQDQLNTTRNGNGAGIPWKPAAGLPAGGQENAPGGR